MTNVETLARDWISAKHDESTAQKSRLNIEAQLIEALGAKVEGAETHEIGNYKVTLTGKLSRSLDQAVWAIVKRDIPTAMRPVKTTVTADTTGVKWLQENKPEMWAKVSEAFTTKPAKTACAVREV